MEKICNRCGIPKPLEAFSRHPDTKDGYLNQCKDCRSEYARAHYAKRAKDPNWIPWHIRNKAKVKQNKTRWLAKNPEKAKAQYRRDYLKKRYASGKGTLVALSNVWRLMIRRCDDQLSNSYRFYGARGITVCDEWRKSKASFIDWALKNGYREGLTLDRTENNGNYEPSNCAWKTYLEQASNTRRSVLITINGETRSLSQWSRFYNIPISRASFRYRSGFSAKDIFSQNDLRTCKR